MKEKMITVSIILICLISCNNYQSSTTEKKKLSTKIETNASIQRVSMIPEDVKYNIISENTLHSIKRTLEIRLNKKVPEKILKEIALELKYSDFNNYERTFITYYLLDMTVGAGAWATTHFNPELEVKILGLTEEKENKLIETKSSSNRDVIGIWLDERPYVSSKITIFQENSKLYMENLFDDGSAYKKEIKEVNNSRGRRFEKIEKSDFGDHYIINIDGKLEMRDNEGLVTAAKKIEQQ
ncbi:MAG: hypothetical protein P9L94_16705 [Candidatus Hinthialibacter antarcticus]|nr:hypothetical protein [Candidatus Hinthialibacter antarcticus]